jgi:hypothetical protein
MTVKLHYKRILLSGKIKNYQLRDSGILGLRNEGMKKADSMAERIKE